MIDLFSSSLAWLLALAAAFVWGFIAAFGLRDIRTYWAGWRAGRAAGERAGGRQETIDYMLGRTQ